MYVFIFFVFYVLCFFLYFLLVNVMLTMLRQEYVTLQESPHYHSLSVHASHILILISLR